MDPCLCMTAKPKHSLLAIGRPMASLQLLECSLCMALEGACRTSVGARRTGAACITLAHVQPWNGSLESIDTQLSIVVKSSLSHSVHGRCTSVDSCIPRERVCTSRGAFAPNSSFDSITAGHAAAGPCCNSAWAATFLIIQNFCNCHDELLSMHD